MCGKDYEEKWYDMWVLSHVWESHEDAGFDKWELSYLCESHMYKM